MNILITGVAGFIGTNLAKRILETTDHYVIGIDNLYTGSKQNVNILKEIGGKRFYFIETDILKPIDLALEVHQVYHLAAPASPPHYQKDPIYTWKVNVIGTYNVMDFAYQKDAKVLFASTSEVYGDPLQIPQKEDYWGNVNPVGVRSCYDEGKRAAETLMMDAFRKLDVNMTIIRIFNTYGPYMSPTDGRVISNFLTQIVKNEPLTIYGDGTQTRSFCYVDDLVEGMIRVMNYEEKFPGPVNLGNPSEISINDLAEKVIQITGINPGKVYKPLPQDDPKRRLPDITLAKKMFNWQPTTSLDDGIRKTFEYFKNLLGETK